MNTIFSSSDMLRMGKSKPCPQALVKLTGSQTLDVGALSEYFEPLRKWMVEQRQQLGYAAPDGVANPSPPQLESPILFQSCLTRLQACCSH